MASLGIGLIGAGMVGQMCHLANFVQIPECRVVALAELRPNLARRAAEKFGVSRVYETHTALLEDPDVQAVVVVTRRTATGPIVLDALESGRHVLSEKPMCHTVAQAERLVSAAATRNLVYAVGYMKRHDPGVTRAKALIQKTRLEGTFGALLLVRCWSHGGDTGGPAGAFVMTDESRPEGLTLWPSGPSFLPQELWTAYDWFLNVHSHIINLLRYLLDATPEVRDAQVQDRRAGLVALSFGATPALIEIAEVSSPHWHEGVELTFERGTIRVSLPPPFRCDLYADIVVQQHGAPPETVPAPGDWAFRRQAEAYVADVGRRAMPRASGADSIADLALAEAIWRRQVGVAR